MIDSHVSPAVCVRACNNVAITLAQMGPHQLVRTFPSARGISSLYLQEEHRRYHGNQVGDTTYHEVSNGAVENGVVIVTIPTMTDEVLTSYWNLSQQMSSVH